MLAKLTDPWFEAKFIGFINSEGKSHRVHHEDGSPISFAEAQGLFLYCPCGYAHQDKFPLDGGRPHGVLIIFSGRGAPDDYGPVSKNAKSHPRWNVGGSSLNDLTCTPSVSVGDPECWHGFITNGEVRNA